MRRLASLGVAAVITVALATPLVTSVAEAAPQVRRSPASSSDSASAVGAAGARAAKGQDFKIKRSERGVQPGTSELVLTAVGFKGLKGSVRFSIVEKNGAALKERARIKKGKAKLAVPALATGLYKVKATYGSLRGKTTFEVYDSLITISTTTLTCDISSPQLSTPLSGSVRYKGVPATRGFVDFYQDGRTEGGQTSPFLLGYEGLDTDGSGSFDSGVDFCNQVTGGDESGLARGNLAAFPAGGPYTFAAFYTDNAFYAGYISSDILTVTVVP